jgi:hypothetical protein
VRRVRRQDGEEEEEVGGLFFTERRLFFGKFWSPMGDGMYLSVWTGRAVPVVVLRLFKMRILMNKYMLKNACGHLVKYLDGDSIWLH